MGSHKTILLIDDNAKLNDINSRALLSQGYRVRTARTLEEARKHLSDCDPDVILLDILLPDGDGIAFCAEIRERQTAHILFLTSMAEEGDRIKGLDSGGDDYITKPYKLEELLSRVRAALRRRDMSVTLPVPKVIRGTLTLDIHSLRGMCCGKDMLLSQKEFALLRLFMSRENEIISAAQIYREVWNLPMLGSGHAVKNTVSRLRKKLRAVNSGFSVAALRGRGYRFEQDCDMQAAE